MNIELDSYVIRARIWPALIAGAPAIFLAFSLVPLDWKNWETVGGLAIALGLLAILEHFGRERGFRLQPDLFKAWDGAPTTRMLRYRDSSLNSFTKKRYREKLATLVPIDVMPTWERESEDPGTADAIYESCGQYLRAKTRKKDDYPLVFAKNVEYGFRRNCLGLRTPAIWLGSGCLLTTLILAVSGAASLRVIVLLSGILDCLLVLWWTKTVSVDWVRSAADAYAEALLAACDHLEKASAANAPK